MQDDLRPFNPLEKTLHELTLLDLNRLRGISEGWFVEYKVQSIEADKIARSVSSFANQYGGWLFFGVRGGPDNTAIAFPGIPTSEAQALHERIQAAASEQVNPIPPFDVRSLTGPCPEIDLQEGRSIVVVSVRAGRYTPYIHKSGRVFRRVGDATANSTTTMDDIWSTHVKGRHELESLFARGRRNRDFIEAFLVPPGDSSPAPMIHVALASERLGDDGPEMAQGVTEGDFVRTLSKEGGVTFDAFFPAQDCLTAQMRGGNYGIQRRLIPTLRHYSSRQLTLFSSGLSSFSVPGQGGSPPLCELALRLYRVFCDECVTQKLGKVSAFSLDAGFFTIGAMAARHRELMELVGLKGPTFVRLGLSGVLNWAPFLGCEAYIAQVQQQGIPLIQTPTVSSGSWERMEVRPKSPDALVANLGSGARPFVDLCICSGVSPSVFSTRWVEPILLGAAKTKSL